MAGSTGRVGAPATMPPWTAFCSLLQKNVLGRRTVAGRNTRQQLRIIIFTRIERTYDRRRRQAD